MTSSAADHPHGPVAAALPDVLREGLGLTAHPLRLGLWGPSGHGRDVASLRGRCVVHWMMHAQRSHANLALDAAIEAGAALGLPVVVLVRLGRGPVEHNRRHLAFMLAGLQDVASGLAERGIPLVIGPPGGSAAGYLAALEPALVTCDEDAMLPARAARAAVAAQLPCPLVGVDADVIVPQRHHAKAEYAARTIRPRIHRVLAEHVDEPHRDPAPVRSLPGSLVDRARAAGLVVADDGVDWDALQSAALEGWSLPLDPPPVDRASGRAAALALLERFVRSGLDGYGSRRNHPDQDGTSLLSAHLHYGHLSVHEVVHAVRARHAELPEDVDSFLEELIVRRELAINWVRFTPGYTQLASAPQWARTTLAEHAGDPRPWSYSMAELVRARTHDPLWNAAQLQMELTGHMHGYVRMYWAKKILEWSPDPAEAWQVALTLNDRYSLDGRDPNGVVGVAWAIGGVHDRAWTERPIFGKVRYMSLASTGRKFDSSTYIDRWTTSQGQLAID